MYSIIILILGSFLALVAVMLIFAPNLLEKLNEYMNKIVFSDKHFYMHRYISAAICLGISLFLFYSYYQHGHKFMIL
jgi:uncharacterized BrkB/YihY/UPF0761 family membrane protein